MSISNSIEKLKQNIKNIYEETGKQIGENIYRGHKRTISTDIEDKIALFLASILPNSYKLFLDPSIYIDKKTHRPDLLVLNSDNTVIALIEIKANMGWCRNATPVINNIVDNNKTFKNENKLKCVFSENEEKTANYGDNVKLFLISVTSGNCSQQNHIKNKEYAKKNNVYQFNLFDGWYDSLSNCEIEDFINEIIK